VPLFIKAWKADKPLMGKCDKFLADASADTIETAKNKDIELGDLSYLKAIKKDDLLSVCS
jgi:hypothetical protein